MHDYDFNRENASVEKDALPSISQASLRPLVIWSSSTVSLIGILTYRSKLSLRWSPWLSSHSAAIFSIRLIPSDLSSCTCSGRVSSGPRYKKFGRIMDTVKVGNSASAEVRSSGRAVLGDGGGRSMHSGVSGVRGGVGRVNLGDGGGGGRNSAGLVTQRGDGAGGVWLECRRLRWEGDCGGR